jgi:hypothetical protein
MSPREPEQPLAGAEGFCRIHGGFSLSGDSVVSIDQWRADDHVLGEDPFTVLVGDGERLGLAGKRRGGEYPTEPAARRMRVERGG